MLCLYLLSLYSFMHVAFSSIYEMHKSELLSFFSEQNAVMFFPVAPTTERPAVPQSQYLNDHGTLVFIDISLRSNFGDTTFSLSIHLGWNFLFTSSVSLNQAEPLNLSVCLSLLLVLSIVLPLHYTIVGFFWACLGLAVSEAVSS